MAAGRNRACHGAGSGANAGEDNGLGGKTAAGESDDSSAGRHRACRGAGSGANAGEDNGLGGKTAAGESDDSSAGRQWLAAARAANGWPPECVTADCKRTRKLLSCPSRKEEAAEVAVAMQL